MSKPYVWGPLLASFAAQQAGGGALDFLVQTGDQRQEERARAGTGPRAFSGRWVLNAAASDSFLSKLKDLRTTRDGTEPDTGPSAISRVAGGARGAQGIAGGNRSPAARDRRPLPGDGAAGNLQHAATEQLFASVRQPPMTLTIVQNGHDFMVSTDDGSSQLFSLNGQTANSDDGATAISAGWEGETVVTERRVGEDPKLLARYVLSADRKRLTIVSLVVSRVIGQPVFVRHVYDAADTR